MQGYYSAGGFAVIVQEVNDDLERFAGLVNVWTFGNSLDRLHARHARPVLESGDIALSRVKRSEARRDENEWIKY